VLQRQAWWTPSFFAATIIRITQGALKRPMLRLGTARGCVDEMSSGRHQQLAAHRHEGNRRASR
jgi:hypothetical protein